jgi:hypothetical protein
MFAPVSQVSVIKLVALAETRRTRFVYPRGSMIGQSCFDCGQFSVVALEAESGCPGIGE